MVIMVIQACSCGFMSRLGKKKMSPNNPAYPECVSATNNGRLEPGCGLTMVAVIRNQTGDSPGVYQATDMEIDILHQDMAKHLLDEQKMALAKMPAQTSGAPQL